MKNSAQVQRIRAKVSGEAGRNAANQIGTKGQTASTPKRIAVTSGMSAANSGDMGQPGVPTTKKVVRNSALKLGSFDGIEQNRPRSGKGSAYGGLPSSKKGGRKDGVD